MADYELFLDKGYLFAKHPEGEFLVDTGSPTSIGKGDVLTVGEACYPLGKTFAGGAKLTIEQLARSVGRDVDGLIGTDVLNLYDVEWDLAKGRMRYVSELLSGEGEHVPLGFVIGCPFVTVKVGETLLPRPLFFDTGAAISYVRHSLLGGYPSEGSIDDFFPTLTEFEPFTTETVRAPLTLSETAYPLRVGSLPPAFEYLCTMAGTDGLLGNELLQGRVVQYSARRSSLWVGRN